jgi:hypothetical protein
LGGRGSGTGRRVTIIKEIKGNVSAENTKSGAESKRE